MEWNFKDFSKTIIVAKESTYLFEILLFSSHDTFNIIVWTKQFGLLAYENNLMCIWLKQLETLIRYDDYYH